MNYMILIYGDPAREPAYGTPEFTEMMAGYTAANRKMQADGVIRSGDALRGVDTAKSLRITAGKVETMDGPFAETREHLGGYYIIDVPDMETALSYAALIPTAAFGTIEIRPVMNYNPTGT
jgi:hypothetical protein